MPHKINIVNNFCCNSGIKQCSYHYHIHHPSSSCHIPYFTYGVIYLFIWSICRWSFFPYLKVRYIFYPNMASSDYCKQINAQLNEPDFDPFRNVCVDSTHRVPHSTFYVTVWLQAWTHHNFMPPLQHIASYRTRFSSFDAGFSWECTSTSTIQNKVGWEPELILLTKCILE